MKTGRTLNTDPSDLAVCSTCCLKGVRLARECAKLDLRFERELAEAGLANDFEEWPDY